MFAIGFMATTFVVLCTLVVSCVQSKAKKQQQQNNLSSSTSSTSTSTKSSSASASSESNANVVAVERDQDTSHDVVAQAFVVGFDDVALRSTTSA